MDFDATGKVSFDHLYTQPDPRAYFSALSDLDYCIPQLAKPYFRALASQYRRAHRTRSLTVVDVGCSYGVNAALLRCEASLDELSGRYAGPAADAADRQGLLARDRRWVSDRDRRDGTRFLGVDSSLPAISYAAAAGFIDDAVHADLEERELTGPERDRLAGANLVISTGCVGYISARTITRLASACGRLPWMAHFVLRMFPVEPLADSLAGLGYQTTRHGEPLRQRRFASAQERDQVLATLSEAGVDPRGLEADGWLYAQLHICRPAGQAGPAVIDLAGSST